MASPTGNLSTETPSPSVALHQETWIYWLDALQSVSETTTNTGELTVPLPKQGLWTVWVQSHSQSQWHLTLPNLQPALALPELTANDGLELTLEVSQPEMLKLQGQGTGFVVAMAMDC